MVACERVRPPDVRIVGILDTEHDGRVAHMADIDLAAADERDAGRRAGRAR